MNYKTCKINFKYALLTKLIMFMSLLIFPAYADIQYKSESSEGNARIGEDVNFIQDQELFERNIHLFNAVPDYIEARERAREEKMLSEEGEQQITNGFDNVDILNQFYESYDHRKKVFFKRDQYSGSYEQSNFISMHTYNSIARLRPSHIDFKYSRLYPFDHAGTCTAMALDFLARYNNVCGKIDDSDLCRTCLKLFEPFYRISTTTYNSRQAAFNTIIVEDESSKSLEKLKELRMQALANFHGIKINPATKTYHVSELSESIEFREDINKLKSGQYIVRVIHPDRHRDKKEIYGHTMILIKRDDFSIFYDNSEGPAEIIGDVGKYVEERLIEWHIPDIRVYEANCPATGCINVSDEVYLAN